MSTPAIGSIGWLDLTVDDAPRLRDFYAMVCGWEPSPVAMGEYEDFAMGPAGGEPVAGVCHARGGNADIPASWIPYVVVGDLDASLAAVHGGGGDVIGGVRAMGDARYAIVRDPVGAVIGLYQAG